MNSGFLRSVMFAGLLAVVPMVSSAGTIIPPDIQTGDQVRLIKGSGPSASGALGGGPFQIDGPDLGTTFSASSATDFISFCLEYNENVTWNTPYYVKIADYAQNGGIAGGTPPNGDPLDSRTAFLYWKFLNGSLGPLYDVNNVDSKDGLQLAIWRIEQEVRREWDTASNTFVYRLNYSDPTKATKIGNASKWAYADQFYDMSVGATGHYGMRVMQLWQNADFTGNKQDGIIYVPEGGTTLGLFLIGLVAVGTVRRKIRT